MEQVFQGQMGDLNTEGGSGASYSEQDLSPALPCLREDTAPSWALLSRVMPLAMISKPSKCERPREAAQRVQKYMPNKETVKKEKKIHETVRKSTIAKNTQHKEDLSL